ncbi:MAG TPA: efflux RND transporter periplasmic adaptor subunit [Sumerlaeia bacterium]|nr:efflux RND transporter periplasmic adaptor subunit [Sumerlaeia bacterium]
MTRPIAPNVKRRFASWMLVAVGAGALILAGCPRQEAVKPRRGEIIESFSEPARTRLEKTYPVTMPVNARIGRIELEPGDPVKTGDVLAAIDRLPFEEEVKEARAAVAELEATIRVQQDNRLEETAKVEAQASIDAAMEALKASDSQVEAEKARAEREQKERERMERLAKSRTVSERDLDDAVLAAETAVIELRKQEFYRSAMNFLIVAIRLGPKYIEQWLGRKTLQTEVHVHQLAQARARLARAERQLELAEVRSPIDGVVLERYEQGDSALPAGHPLMLIGDLDQLEVVADVLTQDAMRLAVDSEVLLEAASGIDSIWGNVKRIEPAGFTKLSSLGVEQQRVNVIVSLEGKPEGLGVGYRVQARFVTGRKPDALIVPRFSVLQAPDRSFYVFKVERNRLRKQTVEIGLRADLELEVAGGLSEDDVIVSKPDSVMVDGEKIRVAPK